MDGRAEHLSDAKRLVATLDRIEVKVLTCLVQGMSRKDIASCFGLTPEELKQKFQSTMRKLKAERIAEVVRIGICAGLDEPWPGGS